MINKTCCMIFVLILAAGSAAAREPLPLIDITNPPPGITPPQLLPGSVSTHYPPVALRCSAEGVVGLELTVLKNGTVADVRITSSSGYRILDVEALKDVRAGRFYPAFQKGLPLVVRFKTKYTWKLNGGPHAVLETCLKALGAGDPPLQ